MSSALLKSKLKTAGQCCELEYNRRLHWNIRIFCIKMNCFLAEKTKNEFKITKSRIRERGFPVQLIILEQFGLLVEVETDSWTQELRM